MKDKTHAQDDDMNFAQMRLLWLLILPFFRAFQELMKHKKCLVTQNPRVWDDEEMKTKFGNFVSRNYKIQIVAPIFFHFFFFSEFSRELKRTTKLAQVDRFDIKSR